MSEKETNIVDQEAVQPNTESEQAIRPEQDVPNEQTAQQEPSESQTKKKKALPFILAAVAAILALAVGIGIYNTPENRLHRQLDLGNRYLEEQQYAQAAIAFERAIAIDDRCMEAYVGGVEAYLAAGDASGAKDFYERTLTMLSALDADSLAENMDYAVELYLAAEKVYDGDPDKIAQVLEDGYTVTGEDTRIKDKLVETYLGIGKEETQEGSYEEALKIYDRLLELDSANTETIDGLCDCLNPYIDDLMEAGQYDKIRALAEKYADVAAKVDFASILAKIAELERIEAENRTFMKKVYDLMAAQDYEGMHEVDGSEEAGAFVERMEGDSYLYFPDNNDSLNGVGAGVYQFGEGGYYFYYGDYVNGERKGNGTEFINDNADGYSVFTGVWDQDAPNGEGTETQIGGLSYNGDLRYDQVTSGTLTDGLWDGQVNSVLTASATGEKFDLSFQAVKGVPTEDKTEEYLAEIPWGDRLEEGYYVCAFDYHPSVDSGWWTGCRKGGAVGIAGFQH